MNILRAVVILIAAASLCRGATSEAIVSARQYKRGEPRSCELAIVAVDGRRLKSPQAQVRFPPGRHTLTLQVSFLMGKSQAEAKTVAADAPLAQVFEPHRYTIDGKLSRSGGLRLRVTDEDKKREELRSRKRGR